MKAITVRDRDAGRSLEAILSISDGRKTDKVRKGPAPQRRTWAMTRYTHPIEQPQRRAAPTGFEPVSPP